jgi:hypothetical protein
MTIARYFLIAIWTIGTTGVGISGTTPESKKLGDSEEVFGSYENQGNTVTSRRDIPQKDVSMSGLLISGTSASNAMIEGCMRFVTWEPIEDRGPCSRHAETGVWLAL